MKVLQINSFFSVGGPPRIVNGIYDTLIEKGHKCKIAAAREARYVPDDSILIGRPFDNYINAAKARIFDNEGLSAKHATNKLIQEIERYNPDIIHLHNLHGYYININVLFDYLKKRNKPVVWTLHDCWAFTGHCAHFDLIKCKKWKTGCYDCAQKSEYPSSYVLDMSRRNYIKKEAVFLGVNNLCIVTPSCWLADLVKDSFLGCYPVRVINNGIDLNAFAYKPSSILERHHLQEKKIVLGVAQNWAEKKGFEDFIQLSELLDDSYMVVMIGLTDELKKRLPSEVLGLDRINDAKELAEWYSAADVFVNMTYQDTFPTVNLEALACGTPVITYNTGGSPEIIDTTCGIVVQQGDILDVKEAILSLSAKESMRRECLKRASQYSKESKYIEYIELYDSMKGKSI